MSLAPDLDEIGVARVTAMIDAVKAAGLDFEAKMFETIYWGWLRNAQSYVSAHPYVKQPEPGMTPFSALTLVDYSYRHWADQIPGTPKIDDERVRREAAADEAWHQEEDRRMRREAGEGYF